MKKGQRRINRQERARIKRLIFADYSSLEADLVSHEAICKAKPPYLRRRWQYERRRRALKPSATTP